MGDLPLKNSNRMPIDSGSVEAALRVQQMRADSAEARIREIENSPIFLADLEKDELLFMHQQKCIIDKIENEKRELAEQYSEISLKSHMLSISYNDSWIKLKKKYGLPSDILVDWETGQVFMNRKDRVDG